MSQPIRIGLLRLVDSAPVLVAEQRGLFAKHGLDVRISIEPSWSNLADKLTYGMLDAAVMLPPLVLAAAMGLRGPAAKMVVAMGLSQGGNGIVLSNKAADRVASPDRPTGRMMLPIAASSALMPTRRIILGSGAGSGSLHFSQSTRARRWPMIA